MPRSKLPPPRWITFDCYGTLIDWETGVRRAFVDLMRVSEEEAAALFEAWERIQFEKIQGPYLHYAEILWASFRQAVEEADLRCPGYAGESFVESLGKWPPFPDVNPALGVLARRFRMGIISNIDRNLLGKSLRHFPVRFDALVTAEDARAYKPSEIIFRCALERLACPPEEVAHVAFGAEYDLKPAHSLGMRVVYLNRKGLPAPALPLEAEITSAAELPEIW